MRRTFVVVVAPLFVAATPGTALSKEFTLPEAHVRVKVLPDGALRVTESITYSFSGHFEGGFREIPLRPGESLVDAAVYEDGVAYTPGASAELGSEGAPGTFGTTATDEGKRIVWHYDATDERRTFLITYTLTGLAEAWDDVVDVNLRVWGDEWDVELGRLTGRIVVPNPAPRTVRVWGHATGVDGATELLARGRGAALVAEYVPPGRFVEMRVVFPRSQLDPIPERAEARSGEGLPRILEEEAAFAESAAADRRRARWVRSNLRG